MNKRKLMNINVNMAKSAGFCFGVRRAINITLDAARSSRNVLMLGDIVHNEDVVRDIKRAGVKKINKLTTGKNKILLIRAHGAPISIYKNAKRLGYKIIDATCPMVTEIHNLVKEAEASGRFVIVIGDKKHDEVQGIIGQLKKKGIVIDSPDKIPAGRLKSVKKACVVVQSTQDIENVNRIMNVLKLHIHDLIFHNTICGTTRVRQQEIKSMPLKNDIMLIIGSKTSANTKRLYQISKSVNKNSYWIQSSKDIKKDWFKDALSVGITSGASTPDYVTKEIIEKVKRIG